MKRILSVGLLLLLVLIWAAPAFAQGGDQGSGQLVFGRNVTLATGDSISGDLTLFGGNLTMAAGSWISGNLVVFGGNADIAGEVRGQVVTIGGNISLKSAARVQGDVSSVGGHVTRAAGAQVTGKVVEGGRFDLSRFFPWSAGIRFGPSAATWPAISAGQSIFHIFRALVLSMVVAVIGLLVVLFLPDHTRVIGRAVTGATAASFGTGLLTVLAGAAVIIVLVITICLAPLGILLALPLGLATLLGWVVVGYLVGQRLMTVLKKDAAPAPMVTALVGVLVLSVVQQLLIALGDVPCLGFFFWLLGAGLWLVAACTGLGAVVLSRLGTQPYPGGIAAYLPGPPAPTIAPAAKPVGPAPKEDASVTPDSEPPATVSDTAPAEAPAPSPEEAPAAAPKKPTRRRSPRKRTTEPD
jgi:hypothetical protein